MKKDSWTLWAMIVAGAAVFVYILLRGFLLSFTHDEALTVLLYSVQSWGEIFDVHYTNNHLLNSVLTRFSYDLFGASEGALRLPNMLAGLLYLVFAVRIVRKIFGARWIGFFAFLLICANALLIDFFSLCRGYGLSMAFLLAGCYYLLLFFEKNYATRWALLSLAMTALATTANYTLLPFFLLQMAVVLFFELRETFLHWKRERNWKRIPGSVLLLGGAICFAWWMTNLMLRLKEVGNFDFGGQDGFWNSSVRSLAQISLLGEWQLIYDWVIDLFPPLATGLVFFIFIVGLLATAYVLWKGPRTPLVFFQAFLLLALTGCGVGIWVQHVWMKIPYSTDRTVLYFIPLFSLFVSVALMTPGKWQRLRRVLAFVFLVHPVLAFVLSLNLQSTPLWAVNAGARDAVIALESDAGHDKRMNIVTVAYLNFPVYNFYLFQSGNRDLNFLSQAEIDFKPGCDYYFGPEKPNDDYSIIYEKGETRLWKNTAPLCDTKGRQLVATRAPIPGAPLTEFPLRIFEERNDTFATGTWFRLDASMLTNELHAEDMISVSVDRHGTGVYWQTIPAAWFVRSAGAWTPCEQYFYLNEPILPGDRVCSYLFAKKDLRMQLNTLTLTELRRDTCTGSQ